MTAAPSSRKTDFFSLNLYVYGEMCGWERFVGLGNSLWQNSNLAITLRKTSGLLRESSTSASVRECISAVSATETIRETEYMYF